ncbi:glycosyl hydrolase family 28-related protein [Paenibacillus sp. GYB003]|uniref:glycosyl hydrolase family 28-related protein n=1 Tax=Paenibacillus sp. GYB003 TaxID=2994392 RepID=UPI002F96CEFD
MTNGREHSNEARPEQHPMTERPLSRRKLLASLGMIGAGAYMTAVGARGANAASVAETVYSPSGGAPFPHQRQPGSWIDITQPPYNAKPGGSFDNSAVFQKAVDDASNDGGKIYVPAGDYLLQSGFTINKERLTLEGTGRLLLGRHISLVAGGFRCSGLRFKAVDATSQIRCIQAESALIGASIERITIENCEFEDFFYATNFRGTEQYPIKDIVVTGCRSTAPAMTNAGHFQNICTFNTYYGGNACYNGQNATSYNFFGGNGKIKIVGNYDSNNSYGSCEIENSPGAEVVISSNNFDKQLWIDDSSTVIIEGNIVKERIFVTVQDNDCKNVIISGNIADRIYVDKFSTYRAGKVKHLEICHNELTGPGGWGIFIRGTYAETCRIVDNRIASGFTSGSIGIVRGPELDLDISGNDVNGLILFSGSGGSIRVYANRNYTLSGKNDAPVLERLFQSSGASLNAADVKFVQSQTIRMAAGAPGTAVFAIDPVAAGSGKVVKLTYTACVQQAALVFDAAEQSIIIAGGGGAASVTAGGLSKVSGNAASAFGTAFRLNAEMTELRVVVTNQGAGPMTVGISCMEHAAVKA